MTVLEILKLASGYLDLDDELLPIFEGEETGSVSQNEGSQTDNTQNEETQNVEAQKDFTKMMLSLNSVLHELATTKFKPKKVLSYDCLGQTVINLSDIHANVIKIIRIFNKFGNVDFKIENDKVNFYSNVPVCIEFSYIPFVSTLNDKVNEFNFIGAKILAMGVVGEYYLLSGIFDDATYFKNEFLNGVDCCLNKNFHIKARRWE